MEKRTVQTCVLVADGGRARFFHVRLPEDADYAAGPRLRECETLVNPDGQLTGNELYANTKSGRRQSPGGGPVHGTDDHRGRHEDEIERRFAKRIVEVTKGLVGQHQVEKLVVLAAPRMLGQLRSAGPWPDALVVEELQRDASWHSVSNIERILEEKGLLEPRVLPETVYRPPGQPLPQP